MDSSSASVRNEFENVVPIRGLNPGVRMSLDSDIITVRNVVFAAKEIKIQLCGQKKQCIIQEGSFDIILPFTALTIEEAWNNLKNGVDFAISQNFRFCFGERESVTNNIYSLTGQGLLEQIFRHQYWASLGGVNCLISDEKWNGICQWRANIDAELIKVLSTENISQGELEKMRDIVIAILLPWLQGECKHCLPACWQGINAKAEADAICKIARVCVKAFYHEKKRCPHSWMLVMSGGHIRVQQQEDSRIPLGSDIRIVGCECSFLTIHKKPILVFLVAALVGSIFVIRKIINKSRQVVQKNVDGEVILKGDSISQENTEEQ